MSEHIDWDNFFMSMAYLASMKSKYPSSRIGAVLVGSNNEVISLGYNGLPRGVRDKLPEREERPIKYSFYEHAERNAVYNSARIGVSTQGARCYTQGTPCADCARAMIQAGIEEIIVDGRWEKGLIQNTAANTGTRPKWENSAEISKEMLEEAGVKVRQYEGPLITTLCGRRSGDIFEIK